MGKPRGSSVSSAVGTAAPRIERKIIEKNRRTRMKTFYSNLISLIPNHSSKVEGLPLPDQIDEAVEHIKSMKMKLEKLREKKELLLRGKRSSDSCITNENQAIKISPPLIEVHDMGPNLGVVLANGIRDYSTFHDIIRLIHQHGVEIANASFVRDGNSTIQVLQDKVGQPKMGMGFEGATMSRKLKELVCGASSSSEVVESDQLNLWDYEIESNIWGFEIPQVFPAAGTNFGYCEEFLNMGNLYM